MCVLVHRSTRVAEPWDAANVVINVPDGLPAARTWFTIRAVLAGLGVAQPLVGAVCWCGEQVSSTPTRVPAQRTDSEAIAHGA